MSLERFFLAGTDATTLDEIEVEGYISNSRSSDGTLCMLNSKDGSIPTLTSYPNLPSYADENLDPKNMTRAEAKNLILTQATTSGGSDGWFYNSRS